MAGVSVAAQQSGGRRGVDTEINLVPMIDLFVVCVTFLLLTAVWSQMSRLELNSQGPGSTVDPPTDTPLEKVLTVEMQQADRFVLVWKSGQTVHATTEVMRKAVPGVDGDARYPDLAKAIEEQWKLYGTHQNADDRVQDRAVLSVDNRAPFSEIVAVIDAIYGSKRKLGDSDVNAFAVTFATR